MAPGQPYTASYTGSCRTSLKVSCFEGRANGLKQQHQGALLPVHGMHLLQVCRTAVALSQAWLLAWKHRSLHAPVKGPLLYSCVKNTVWYNMLQLVCACALQPLRPFESVATPLANCSKFSHVLLSRPCQAGFQAAWDALPALAGLIHSH